MVLQFQVWISRSELQLMVQQLFLQELLQKVGSLEKTYILCKMESTAQNRRPCQVWFCSSYQLRPDVQNLRVRNPLWIELSQTVVRSPECVSANCFQMQGSEKIPKGLLLENSHFIVHLCSRILSFQELFLVPFLPLSSRNLHNNSKPAPQILSWFIEWMIRNKRSVFEASALKCMVSLPFFFFRIPRLKSTVTPEYWMTCIFESFHHSSCGIFPSDAYGRVPYHFISSPGPRNVQCPCENLFAYSLTCLNSEYRFSHFLFLSNERRWTLTWGWFGL